MPILDSLRRPLGSDWPPDHGALTPRTPPAPRTLARVAGRVAGRAAMATTVGGATALAYSVSETRWFALRRVDVPVLPIGHDPVRVLHLSDLHLTPSQHRKQAWVRRLADLHPDLVVDTGDNLGHRDAVPPLLESLGPLLEAPGVFVLGSNDYFAPSLRNPVRYLLPDDGRRNTHTERLPTQALREGLSGHGWVDLTNRRATVTVRGIRMSFAGVDDPHLGYDDLPAVSGPADSSADLRVAVTHAPYLRVLDRFVTDGYDAIFAGHTHGGQLRLPGVGALVTNCDLEPARARGLHRHAVNGPAGPASAWLHVSAGLGTSPYAPVRFCCRPEVTLLRLVPVS